MAELRKKHLSTERGAEEQQTQQAASHEHKPRISIYSLTSGIFFQMDFWRDTQHLISNEAAGRRVLWPPELARPQSCSVLSSELPALIPQQALPRTLNHKHHPPSSFSIRGTITHRLSDETKSETESVSQPRPKAPRMLQKRANPRAASTALSSSSPSKAHQAR